MISSEKIVSNGTGSSSGSGSTSSSFEEEKDERMSTSSGEGGSNKSAAGSSLSSSSSSSFSSNKKDAKKKLKSTKKDRRDPERFMGDGVIFKGKLIGVRDVAQPRGEAMAREALQELKSQKKTSGEHKQKITVSIALDGLQIKDDKTKVLLHLHPVHKISFISQDASDSRAFGYIYGSPENEHTFYAIKTEKAAQQIVMCMRDLFQIAYELKKDEIVTYRRQQLLAKQSTPECSVSNSEAQPSIGSSVDSKVMNEAEGTISQTSNTASDVLLDLSSTEVTKEVTDMLGPIDDGGKTGSDAFFSDPWGYLRSMEDQFGVPIDHIDPFNPDAHQQASPMGLSRSVGLVAIGNPSPFGLAHHAAFSPSNDPFNTSFVHVPNVPYVQTFSLSVPTIQCDFVAEDVKTTGSQPRICASDTSSEDKYAAFTEIAEAECDASSCEPTMDVSSLGETVTSMRISESSSDVGSTCSSESSNVQFCHSVGSLQLLPPPLLPSSVFSDLDPLGKDRPYVDKKDFFYDLKNPPKKVLKDLIAENGFSTTLEFAEMAPSPSPSQASSSSEDDLSPSMPSTATSVPPPLPPPFNHNQNHYRRRTSTISPTSSLEDATMASCSSSSSSSSATSSPIGEIFLPPPPPPPRPSTSILPSVCPPPVPRRQASQISSPPIPIPSRRTETTNTNNIASISSSSWDSNYNGGQWRPLTTVNSGSTTNGHLPKSLNNNKNSKEISRNVRNSAATNPFGVDIFLSPPTPVMSASIAKRNIQQQQQPMTQANIFQKEVDPFAGDDFFSTLHSGKQPMNNQGRSQDFTWAADNQ